MMYAMIIIASTIINMFFLVDGFDYNMHHIQATHTHHVAEEVAAAALQFFDEEAYSEGEKIFNYEEGIKQALAILADNLQADLATLASEWDYNSRTYEGSMKTAKEGKDIIFKIKFFDDSNTGYPFLFDEDNFTHAIGDPTTIAFIDIGKPKYRSPFQAKNIKRAAAYSWESR